MNNWLQQLNEAYKRILKESDNRISRYWSSSHSWNEIHEPEQYEYGSDRFYGDGRQMSQNSGAPTGYVVHAHSGQIVPKHVLNSLARKEVEAFHKAEHDFERAEHGAHEEEGILFAHGLAHIDTEETPEGIFDSHHMSKEVDREMERGRKTTPHHPDADPHIKHFKTLKEKQK